MTEAVDTYHVHAAWKSVEPIGDATLAAASSIVRCDDETFCIWVDEKDQSQMIASWDLAASSIEDAARACKAAAVRMSQASGLRLDLSEVGVSTDEGYWVSTDPELDIPD